MNDFDSTMRISELIETLKDLKAEFGDIPMYITVKDSEECLSKIKSVRNLEISKPIENGVSVKMNVATIANVCFDCDNTDCEYHYKHEHEDSEE